MKNSESQGALEKSQLQSQSKTDNKSSEMKDMDLPNSECTDNIILTTKNKVDNEFNCIICEKSFLSKHNLKVHDKRLHTKQGSESTYKCDNCNLIGLGPIQSKPLKQCHVSWFMVRSVVK